MPPTVVSFHAHPDDEALLTGGSLARAAAEGHRVVLVVATDGEAGLTGGSRSHDLGRRRAVELDAAAAALGCARVVRLELPDSGWRSSARPGEVFSRLPLPRAAAGLIAVLAEERAELLTTYDVAGGYGHPDHRQVHHVGAYAAIQAKTPVVLQATAPRERLSRVIRVLARLPGLLDQVDPAAFAAAFTPRAEITHVVDVREHLQAKRAAMAAHATQADSDDGIRTLALLLRLPPLMFEVVAGREWFVDAARPGARARQLFV